MHPPFCWGGGRGVEPPTKFSNRGGGSLTGPQVLEGVAGKEGGEVAIFTQKIKSEIFDDKKKL